jgi:hypothetical protein
MTNALTAVMVSVAIGSQPLLADKGFDEWSRVASFGREEIRITLRGGTRVRGAVRELFDDVLVLDTQGRWRDVPRADVCDVAVDRPTGRSDPHPIIVGGMLAGIILGGKLGKDEGIGPLIEGGLIGTVVGWVVGTGRAIARARHRWVSVYHRRSAC